MYYFVFIVYANWYRKGISLIAKDEICQIIFNNNTKHQIAFNIVKLAFCRSYNLNISDQWPIWIRFKKVWEFISQKITYLNLILEKVVWLNMTPYCECSASESFGRKSTEGYIIYIFFCNLFLWNRFSTFLHRVLSLLIFLFTEYVCVCVSVSIFSPVHLFDTSFTWQYYAGLSVSMLGKIIFLFQTHFGSKTFLFPLLCHLLQMLFYAGSLCI